MKHSFIIIVTLMFVVCNANSQIKKNVTKKAVAVKKTNVKETKTDEQLAIEKAQLWFKEKYVETKFKDPYSYRVVGIKAVAVTNEDYIEKLVVKAKNNMASINLAPEERNKSALEACKKIIKECDERTSLSSSLYERNQKIKKEAQLIAKEIELYLESEEQLKTLIKKKEEMSLEQRCSIVFYDIHLDCYSKNELGNEVLGRFIFPFTKDGVFRDDATTLQMVEKIN